MFVSSQSLSSSDYSVKRDFAERDFKIIDQRTEILSVIIRRGETREDVILKLANMDQIIKSLDHVFLGTFIHY